MKHLFLAILLLGLTGLFAQEQKANEWKPPYKLTAPQEWRTELMAVPIDFAPQIPYKGVEDLRFAPGWGDATKEDYWSYCFLWHLDGEVKLNNEKLQQHLKDYYSGLVGRNIPRRNIPKEKLVPTIATIIKNQHTKGDEATFSGTISMLDYMEQKPMVLNCVIHVKTCPGPSKTLVFFELSPKSTSEKIWQDMNSIWENFSCNLY
jgi:hypothetical protein